VPLKQLKFFCAAQGPVSRPLKRRTTMKIKTNVKAGTWVEGGKTFND
jgi:hypothetical protein